MLGWRTVFAGALKSAGFMYVVPMRVLICSLMYSSGVHDRVGKPSVSTLHTESERNLRAVQNLSLTPLRSYPLECESVVKRCARVRSVSLVPKWG